MGTSKKESIRGDIRIIIIMNIDSKKMRITLISEIMMSMKNMNREDIIIIEECIEEEVVMRGIIIITTMIIDSRIDMREEEDLKGDMKEEEDLIEGIEEEVDLKEEGLLTEEEVEETKMEYN